MRSVFLVLAILATVLLPRSWASEWSDTELHVLQGSGYRDTVDDEKFSRTVITLQDTRGWSWGRTFYFIDFAKSDSRDQRNFEYYGEGYLVASTQKLFKIDWTGTPLKDLGLTAGINYGRKHSPFSPNARVVSFGGTLDLDVPKFDYFSIDLLTYQNIGRYNGFGGGNLCGRHDTAYLISPYWKLPFQIGNAKFSFQGFTDIIGAHGDCKQQVLAQPQLRWDVGNHFGNPDKVFLGFEYQYWRNKYGTPGLRDNVLQALLVFKL